ncbi:uncharacterized protein LOC142321137 [Lycorma delicatula]|uniref:uncharacterized protein LOC142321137 n=1 Tax=Lycorma delicatula TaxID=130591 RepID=UPI003F515261
MGKKRDVSAPLVAADYNSYMGGIDLADRLHTVYGINRKCKKWWHRLFWGLLEMTFINSYLIFSEIDGKIPLIDFRWSVARGLLTFTEPKKGSISIKRRSLEQLPEQNKKRRGKSFSVPKDVREGNRGVHWPVFIDIRRLCEICSINGIQSRPYNKCSHCGVHLCCSDKKSCFVAFHNISEK